jgi:Rrf2 family nitric oxide-sensitive transcriptional repressor
MFLAVREPRASTVNDVAESYGISRNSKLTLNLKTLGLVSTARAVQAAFRLALSPEPIASARSCASPATNSPSWNE